MADKFKIESGIPLPEQQFTYKYPWRELTPGDSFFVPGATRATMASQISWAQKRVGIRLACRSVDGGVRVWRLPDEDADD